MRRRQGAGTIVRRSSVSGEVTTLVADRHCASKHAVEALADALRLEAAPFGAGSF